MESSGVTKGGGKEDSCPQAQHARGDKTVSPKIFCDLTTTKVSFYRNKLLLFCHIINRLQNTWPNSCFCVFHVYLNRCVVLQICKCKSVNVGAFLQLS